MKYERWLKLEKSKDLPLTQEEIDKGWHWCPDWDDLLIGPGMEEIKACLCAIPVLSREQDRLRSAHQVHQDFDFDTGDYFD
jgi:hypothetical protein